MSDKTTDVMIAGYLTKEPALADYEAVVTSDARIEGAVCVSRDLEGKTSVELTDHMTRGGAKVLGGAGLVVGLFAPPLLASTAIGAAVGGALGKAAHSKVRSKVEAQAEQTIPWGGAGVIVAYPSSSADQVDAAVSRALKKVVGEAEGRKVKALKEALADAQAKAAAPAGTA